QARRPREPRHQPRAYALCAQNPHPGQERRRVEEELRQERELHPVRGREGELVTLGAAQIIFRELWMPFGMTRNEDAADAVRGEPSVPEKGPIDSAESPAISSTRATFASPTRSAIKRSKVARSASRRTGMWGTGSNPWPRIATHVSSVCCHVWPGRWLAKIA